MAPMQRLTDLVELLLPLLGETLSSFVHELIDLIFREAYTGLIICHVFYQNSSNYGRMSRNKRDSTPFPTHIVSYGPIK